MAIVTITLKWDALASFPGFVGLFLNIFNIMIMQSIVTD